LKVLGFKLWFLVFSFKFLIEKGADMPRIVGVDIPNDKSMWISLTYIAGIGKYTSEQILKEAGIEKSTKAGKLSEDELSRITQIIDRNYIVGGRLRRQVAQNIARLRDINCYKGIRHRKGLPVRGQCTQSNARTRKGPRKTVAGKKGVKEKR
jgi:small subunit ribosomal protein S13